MEKNGLKIILLSIIALLIILLTCIINLGKINNNNTSQNNEVEKNITISEDVIVPENSYLFFGKYVSGDVTSKEIYESIYNYGLGKRSSKLAKIEFVGDSIVQTKQYTTSKIIYTYENNETFTINVKVFLKRINNKTSIEFYE